MARRLKDLDELNKYLNYAAEVTKMVEALKLLNEQNNELKIRLKEEREDQKKQNEELKNFYEDLLAKEREEYELLREDRKKQMDMLQNCIVQMTQTFQVRELQHSTEIDELRKALADRAKLGEDECKITTTEIPTTTEEQQDDTETQEQQEIQEQDEETEIPTTTEEQQDEDH